MKKSIIFAIITLMSVVLLVSCGDNTDASIAPSLEERNISDSAQYNTINIIVNGELIHTAKYENNTEITAFDLLKRICEEQGIEYSHLDGYVNSVSGYANTAESGWLYFFNNEMPDVGASDFKITKGYDNIVDFKFMKYSEAFPE